MDLVPNIRFASLELPPEYAKLIRKKKRKFGIKDLRQYGAQGDKVHLLLKREESGEKRKFLATRLMMYAVMLLRLMDWEIILRIVPVIP